MHVESFQPIREEELSSLIRWIASKEGSTINLTEKMFSTTYGITSRAAFGKKFIDQEKFICVVKQAIELSGAGFNVADFFPSVKMLHLVRGEGLNLRGCMKKLTGLWKILSMNMWRSRQQEKQMMMQEKIS